MTPGYFLSANGRIDYGAGSETEHLLFADAIREMIDPVGIEIGVLNGETSAFLLSLGVTLTGIDPLVHDSMEWSLIGSADKIRENTERYGQRWRFIKDRSQRAAVEFEDDSVDFVFVDGSHRYKAVKRDVRLYLPKIKAGGILFLHDSRMNRGGAPFHPGPSQVADEMTLPLIGEAFSMTAFRKP